MNLNNAIAFSQDNNDTKSKHAYESKTDAYRVFARMLDNDNSSNDWQTLLQQSKNWTE